MVDYAFRATYNDEQLHKTWKSLYNRLQKHSKTRNHLAHFMAIIDNSRPLGEGIYLRPGIVNAKAALDGTATAKEYSAKDIKSFRPVFGKLSMSIDEFIRSLPSLEQQ